MEIGILGVGRMGADMVRRLMRAGHTCVVYDLRPEAVQALAPGRGPSTTGQWTGSERRRRAWQ